MCLLVWMDTFQDIATVQCNPGYYWDVGSNSRMVGNYVYAADILTRALSSTSENNCILQEEAEAPVEMHVANLPASIERLVDY